MVDNDNEYDGLLSNKPTSMLLSPDGTAFSPQVHPVLSGECSRVNGYHNSRNILLTQTLQVVMPLHSRKIPSCNKL